ncbi:MAG: cobalamin B12-binding domain-containing protein [Algiphilus sp.]
MIERALVIEAAEAHAVLQNQREATVEVLVTVLHSRAAAAWREFGAEAECEMRNEAHRLLDHFETSIAGYTSSPLVRYLLWLRDVLMARQAEPEAVSHCLDCLEFAFAETASASARAALYGILREVQYALRWYRHATDWRIHSPPDNRRYADFEAALIAGDHALAQQLFRNTLDQHRDPVAAAVELVQPALYSIGRKWQQNQISVAQEHLATAIVEALLADAALGCSREGPAAQTAVLALAPGNRHTVGLRIVADALAEAGWHTRLVPAGEDVCAIVETVTQTCPQVLAVSASLAHHLLGTRALFARVRKRLGAAAPQLLLGGLAVAEYPDIARSMEDIILVPDVRGLGQTLRTLARVA